MLAKAEHEPLGDPCDKCGRPTREHRAPRERRRPARHDDRTEEERCTFLGIDGEGQGRAPHRYTLMGCSDESGERTWIQRPREGLHDLSTLECLEFICGLPRRHTKIFAYSFGYDLTMILRDVDDYTLFRLFRPELRRGEHGPKPVYWKTELPDGEEVTYSLNLLSTKFTIARSTSEYVQISPNKWRAKMGRSIVLNDIWKFFQGRFTVALKEWKIGTPEAIAHMEDMKKNRSKFEALVAAGGAKIIEAYCLEECKYMAELARKLTDAHERVDLKLRSYFGAGSSASAMMDKMGIKAHVKNAREARASDPFELEGAIAAAFFGGRFENSFLGRIPGPVYSADISSAYPYELCFLPCLVHGKWRRTRNRDVMERARVAVVRYSLDEPPRPDRTAWAPFPFRLPDGSIVYPRSSGGGWVWRQEYLAGERIFPNVGFQEAWAYECDCNCVPFADIPIYYRERVRIGKEGPGIVIKLGCNSCYGKLAQSRGGIGAYTRWDWAGLITSGSRSKLLSDALEPLENHWDLLMLATDGVCSKVPIDMPAPKDTGTYDCRNTKGDLVPLGGWEKKTLEGGLFLARPGIYFEPVQKTEEKLEYVRGRGVGRDAMIKNANRIMEALERGDKSLHVTSFDRFIGAKTSISRSLKKPGDTGKGKYRYKRSPVFGEWIDRPVEMSFDPMPKREKVRPDGSLSLRSFPHLTSLAYKPGFTSSPEAELLKAMMQEATEQPEGELGHYEELDMEDLFA